ncbi:unnamed protein product [Ectocarpus sp. 12 AP-2014]
MNRKHSRRSRRRRECDRRDQTLRWPEALPAREYDEVMGAALAGGGDNSSVPSCSALSTALFAATLASRYNDAAAVIRLLEVYGRGIADVRDDNGRTPLHHACRGDDAGLVRLLRRAGADPDAHDCQGNSPLAVAAATGSLACLQLLIQGGSDVNSANEADDTPLHLAVRHGNILCVNALVEGGAQLSRRNTLGFTPREDLLNSEPMFARGRLPKVLRATLAYIQDAEVSAPQSQSPTWTAQDGYGSEDTPATVVSSRQSPIGGHSRHAFDANFNSGPQPPSEGEGPLQQIDTASASGKETEALHYYRHHAKGRAHATATGRLERNRNWDLRELQGSGNVLDGRNEDETFSNGNRRGNRNRLVPISVALDWATDPLCGLFRGVRC